MNGVVLWNRQTLRGPVLSGNKRLSWVLSVENIKLQLERERTQLQLQAVKSDNFSLISSPITHCSKIFHNKHKLNSTRRLIFRVTWHLLKKETSQPLYIFCLYWLGLSKVEHLLHIHRKTVSVPLLNTLIPINRHQLKYFNIWTIKKDLSYYCLL